MKSLVIHEVFRAIARSRGDRIAVECRGRTLTYRELDARSDALSVDIRRNHIERGAHIAILTPRSIDAIVAMLAILKAGCAYVPIDGTYPEAVLRDAMMRSRAAAVMTGGEMTRLSRDRSPRPAPTSDGPETAAYVMFTSGTTGEPKGVVVPHRGVVRLVRDTNYIRIREEDTFLLHSPLTFDASTFEIWGALLNGATLVVYPEPAFDPNVLADTIRSREVTILWLTAGLFHALARRAVESLDGLTTLLAGGDVIHPDAVERIFARYPSITLINGYGPTENTTFTCCHRMTAGSPRGPSIPIGRPITGTSVHVWGPNREPVARGEVGELYTGGLGVALGYLDAPEATAAAFVPDPDHPSQMLYRTGDLVRELPDGALDFVGRSDSLVKVRGYRVSTTEVQQRIHRIDGVEGAVVRAEDDGSGSRSLIAYVQSARDPRSMKQHIKRALEAALPPYMVPNVIHVRATFPLNANGKVDARALAGANET
ncbi:amino acid adenylation domain-containing protein [Pendulispora albinea]|uniref:Amino acid adenylation domain-containing protein n=1 Tax=Pendulispora albinea TaxID=2741071 RepID=A0ABZ2M6R6_9BACT